MVVLPRGFGRKVGHDLYEVPGELGIAHLGPAQRKRLRAAERRRKKREGGPRLAVHVGPRGGRYVICAGRKRYLRM